MPLGSRSRASLDSLWWVPLGLPPIHAGSSDKAAGEAIDALCPGEASSEEDISGECGEAEAMHAGLH